MPADDVDVTKGLGVGHITFPVVHDSQASFFQPKAPKYSVVVSLVRSINFL